MQPQRTYIYTDAEVEINFTDNNGDALIDGDGVLNFFYDDLSVRMKHPPVPSQC
jgi:hypothetical protein